MKLTIDTTPEQDAALAILNAQSNPVDPPTIDVFATSVLVDELNILVKTLQVQKSTTKVEQLQARADKLTDNDLATLQSIIDRIPLSVQSIKP